MTEKNKKGVFNKIKDYLMEDIAKDTSTATETIIENQTTTKLKKNNKPSIFEKIKDYLFEDIPEPKEKKNEIISEEIKEPLEPKKRLWDKFKEFILEDDLPKEKKIIEEDKYIEETSNNESEEESIPLFNEKLMDENEEVQEEQDSEINEEEIETEEKHTLKEQEGFFTPKKLSFNNFLLDKSKGFLIMFYLTIGLFVISSGILFSYFYYNSIIANTIFSIWFVYIIYLIVKRNIDLSLIMIFSQLLLTLIGLQFIEYGYIGIIITSLVLGSVATYLFDKLNPKYIYVNLLFNTLIAILFGTRSIIEPIVIKTGFNFTYSQPTIAFFLSLISFNILYFSYYIKREETTKYLWFNLIPISLFFIIFYALLYLIKLTI